MLHKERKGKVDMRKIDEKLYTAIVQWKDFSLSNTKVVADHNCRLVYLHGYNIARIWKNKIWVSNCGWATNVTAARINACLKAFGSKVRCYNRHGDTEFWVRNEKLHREVIASNYYSEKR